jgi:hypothetical protein
MLSFNKKRKGLKPLRSIQPRCVLAAPSEKIRLSSDEEDGDDGGATNDVEDGVSDDSDWTSSSIDSSENEMLHERAVSQLKDEDIEIHLASELVSRKYVTVNTMINRYSRMLVWFHSNFEKKDADINILQLLKDIILRRFQMLSKYYMFLRTTLQFKPSTIYNFNEDVSVLLNWFAVFRVSQQEEYFVTSNDLYGANLIIRTMRKVYAKERRMLACKSTDNTVEALIRLRKWPPGGLKELHDAVLSQMNWARNVCSATTSCTQDPTVYNNFLQLIVSSFFTGIQSLCLLYLDLSFDNICL